MIFIQNKSYHACRGFVFGAKTVNIVKNHQNHEILSYIMHWGWGETSSRTLECTKCLGGVGGDPPLNTGGMSFCHSVICALIYN